MAAQMTANSRRQIVGRDEADRAAVDEAPQDGRCSDPAIVGVGALEELVEQKNQAWLFPGQVRDLADSSDLREEAGPSRLERVLDVQRGAGGERASVRRSALTGAPAMARTTFTPPLSEVGHHVLNGRWHSSWSTI